MLGFLRRRSSGSLPDWARPEKIQRKNILKFAAYSILALSVLLLLFDRKPVVPHPLEDQTPTPLVTKYIDYGRGDGGRWYIPQEWTDHALTWSYKTLKDYLNLKNPRHPLEAAQLSLNLALRDKQFLDNTKIPLVIHQTWKNFRSETWSPLVRSSVESWLQLATGETYPDLPPMAYIMWDDAAIDYFMLTYEPNFYPYFNMLPHPVEKADAFRVAVLKWFGGVYADVDTKPITHPYTWCRDSDLRTWKDESTGRSYGLGEPRLKPYLPPANAPPRPFPNPVSDWDLDPTSYIHILNYHGLNSTIDVAAIVGIEADCPTDSDQYWRAGYSYPVQLTQWALAMAPQHPIARSFMAQLTKDVAEAVNIEKIDPLDLTGPPAFTKIVKEHVEWHDSGLKWEAVSGLHDAPGGRGKIVAGDTLVLPITGFSPGRGSLNNMGSQSVSHPQARLKHAAAGSWRTWDIKVHTGKLCRTFLGRCKDWDKFVP